MNIQWYPGHMAKTKRMMKESLSLVDVVIELVDARIPYASKNPDVDELAKGKKRILLLNKSDLADAKTTALWADYYKKSDFHVLEMDSLSGKSMKEVVPLCRALMKEKIESQMKRGRKFVPVRAMIVGIPNVGKSTFINSLIGKSSAKTGDKPGVTRGKQWIKIKNDVELLDTPGILWPKFEDETVGKLIAFTGGVNDQILDVATLAQEYILYIRRFSIDYIENRYAVKNTGIPEDVLNKIGEKRGFKSKGGAIDLTRAAIILMDEFRGGKLGKITLESPSDLEERML